MTREPSAFSRVAGGFSSYEGEFRLPLVLAQEVQSSIQLVRESCGLLSSHFRAKSPQLGLGPGHPHPLFYPQPQFPSPTQLGRQLDWGGPSSCQVSCHVPAVCYSRHLTHPHLQKWKWRYHTPKTLTVFFINHTHP